MSNHRNLEFPSTRDGVEALAVAKETVSPLWTSHWNMPSIQDTQGMWKVTPLAEDRLNQQPVLWECGGTAAPNLDRPW